MVTATPASAVPAASIARASRLLARIMIVSVLVVRQEADAWMARDATAVLSPVFVVASHPQSRAGYQHGIGTAPGIPGRPARARWPAGAVSQVRPRHQWR